MYPSSVPIQTVGTRSGEGAIMQMTPRRVPLGALAAAASSRFGVTQGFSRVRSGLIWLQLFPESAER
jgi:hypothetical protein